MQPIRSHITLWCTRLLFAIGVLAFALTGPNVADAALRGCRTDPAIVLSNGVILQADVTYETLPINVVGVNYLIHLPRQGVSVITTIKDPLMGAKERVAFVYDQPADQYIIDTEVFVSPAAVGTRYEAASRLVVGTSKILLQKFIAGTFKTTSSGMFSHTLFG